MKATEDQARSVFLAALEREPDEWPTFLDQACGDDTALRVRVDQLLDAHRAMGSIHRGAAAALVAPVDDPIRERPGDTIGPFKLLEQIGEGGFGVVFMAEQQQPIRRRVALKILKPGMDTGQVIVRFKAERQALALMDHPHIAKVLDAGATPTGRPYFAMELVKGIPITDYCDRGQLTPRERLELFLHVCQAVQHAHQKGIIHRDLKPSNILVTEQDGAPLVKVIDFGVAKALGQQLTEKTLFTGFAQMIGTPLYMSPEQTALSNVDVDTRSDIYSLGVLLYELLTGTTPFDKERLKTVSYEELCRIIREEEPPKPSTRISTLGQAAATVSTQRQSDPRRLSRLFRGELDWIVMKCLEKDRNRRYETANGLAMDVRRYLHDEPVLACPPSAAYRLKKLWRRNRGSVSAAAVVLLCLVGGTVGTTWGLVRAVQAEGEESTQRRLAVQEKTRAEQEKTRAEANLKQARAAVDKLFTGVAQDLANKPHMEKIRRALLRDALEFYQGFLAQKSTDPEMRHETARAYLRVGDIQQQLGNGLPAEAAMRQAVALLEKLVADFPTVPAYRETLAGSRGALSYRLYWVTKHEESVELGRLVLADWEKLAADFPTVPHYQRQLAYAHTDMGNGLKNGLDQLPEAEQHFRQALVVWKKVRANFPKEPEDRFGLSHSHFWLGVLLAHTDRFGEAERELRKALDIRERLSAAAPENHGLKSDLAHVQSYMGSLMRAAGKPHEAAQYYGQAITIREKLRNDFPDNAEQQRRLGCEYWDLSQALLALSRTQEAEDAIRRSLAVRQKLVADHPGVDPYPRDLGSAYFALGLLLHDTNRPQEAAAAFRQAQPLLEETAARLPAVHSYQGDLAWFLGTCPAAQFRDGERAAKAAKRALQRMPTSRKYWRALGIAQYRAGKWQDAVEALEKARELGRGGNCTDWLFLAMTHWQRGDRQQAQKWYDRAVQWLEKNPPPYVYEEYRQLRGFRAEAARLMGINSGR